MDLTHELGATTKRIGGVVVAVAALLVMVAAGSAWGQEPDLEDEAQIDAGSKLEVDFGLEREPLTRTVTLTFDTEDPSAIGDLSIELLGDLKRQDGKEQFPATQITPSATVSGTTARLTVVADPTTPEEVGAGLYTGALRVTGAGVEADEVELSIQLESRNGWTLFWAAVILFGGAIFGAVVRWTNDTGQTLGGLRRRFKRLLPAFDAVDPQDVPTTIARTRVRARMSLEQRDIKPAQGAVTKLESVIEYVAMTSDLATIRRSLDAQRGLVQRKGSVLAQTVMAREEQLLRGLKNTKEPGLADAAVKASEAVSHVLSIEALIRHVCADADRPATESGTDHQASAASLLAKFAGTGSIKEIWQKHQADITALPPVADMTQREPEPPPLLARPFSAAPALLRKLRRRLVHFADVRNVVVFFAAILVMFIGLESQFFGDTGFDGGVRNYLQLFAWAAAIQIVGVEVAQLGSQLYGRRSPPEGLQPQA